MLRAHTIQEFREWIDQALSEVLELKDTTEFDDQYMDDARELLEPLEDSLRALQHKAGKDEYAFGHGDLPFMTAVNAYDDSVLPLRALLLRINHTHLLGLDDKAE